MLPVSIYYYNENLKCEDVREILINPAHIISIAEDMSDDQFTEVVMSGDIYYYVSMPLEVFVDYLRQYTINPLLQ